MYSDGFPRHCEALPRHCRGTAEALPTSLPLAARGPDARFGGAKTRGEEGEIVIEPKMKEWLESIRVPPEALERDAPRKSERPPAWLYVVHSGQVRDTT